MEMDNLLCRRIVERSPEAIIFSDKDGVIRLWNAGAEAMFGYSAQEAVGKTLDIIVPEKMREPHWEGYYRVMKSGSTKYGSELLNVPGIRKDGSRVSLEFSVALIRDENGNLQGISAVMRDVTARWEKEKETKERIAALQAQSKVSGNPSSAFP